MAKKEEHNFKKAINELLSMEVKTEEPKTEELPEIDFSVNSMPEKEMIKESAPVMPEKPVAREEALIPADMVISGNISTNSNMKIMGKIIGDISCEGSVLLLGSVQGNMQVGNLTIQQGELVGDVFVKESMIIEADSTLTGNVAAQSVYSNAEIEGDVKAANNVELKEKALVQGNVTAAILSVKPGAKIKGMVTISE